MGPAARWFQALGVLVFLATAFLPLHGAKQHPQHLARCRALPGVTVTTALAGHESVPAREIYDAVRLDVAGSAAGCATWEVRRWYPFVLAPLWLAALLWVAGPSAAGASRRSRAGALLLGLAVVVAILEACYLAVEYAALFPAVLGRAETVIAWFVVVGILFLRRRADRGLGAVEAHVGAQALLSLLHLLTLPSSEARAWLGSYELGDVCAAVGTNFRAGFWVACAALATAGGATYLSRRRAAMVAVEPRASAPEAAPARG